jgi:hypothetical protein
MATYQNSFDPPPWPQNGSRGKVLGMSVQPSSSSKQVAPAGASSHRERDIAHLSGQMGPRHGVTKWSGRQPTYLPRPSVRDPSHAPESATKSKSASTIGLYRPVVPPSTTNGNPMLRNKNSRNVLRRKPSSIGQHVDSPQPDSRDDEKDSSTSWVMPFPDQQRNIQAPLGPEQYLDLDKREPTLPDVGGPARIIPELVDRYRSLEDQNDNVTERHPFDIPHKLATQDLPPPTPVNSGMSSHSRYSGYSGNSAYSAHSGYSASPSTRFSESPGPGAYSRDTTPTSMSSHSPSVVAPLRMAPRLHQNSPVSTRPPLTRRRTGSVTNESEAVASGLDVQGLPSLRESLTSSSSNSTVKENEKTAKAIKAKKKKRLSPTPPSPPPRKSSQKFQKSRSEDEEESPSKMSAGAARPATASSATSSQMKPSVVKPTPLNTKNIPPARPSRDGTPNLEAQLEESRAVIQSNLPGLHFSPDRRQSNGFIPNTQQAPDQPEASPRPSLSKPPGRKYPPSPILQSRADTIAAPSGLGIVPDLRPVANQTYQHRQIPASRTPSPSTAAPKHRFGFFGRRNKNESEVAKSAQKETTTRKGPAAGTGHEGYGRYAFRGRSGSSGGTRARSHSAASSSQDSVSSTRTHDPFLLERMSPVVIVGGGGIIQNVNASLELTRSESSQSLPVTRPSLESKTSMSQASPLSNLSKEVSRTTLWPSAMPRFGIINGSSTSVALKGASNSESSDNENVGHMQSLAFRRSMQRLQNADQEPLRLPRPLNLTNGRSSPTTSSQGASLRFDDTRNEANQSTSMRKGPITGSKKLSKRPRSPRKWNFFQRSQKSVNPKPLSNTVLPVVVARAPVRHVPYYAMIDSSEQEDDAAIDMEDILREAEVLDLSQSKADSTDSGLRDVELVQQEPDQSPPQPLPVSPPETLLPSMIASPAPVVTDGPKVATKGEDLKEQTPVRPSRLLQVGRIPKVVTARPQQTSPKSFSRPFARLSTIQALPKLDVVDRQSIAAGPSPERSPNPQPRPELPLENTQEEFRHGDSSEQPKPFLVMSPRKNSEATTSSSSGAMDFIGTTAIVPEPDAALEEDEVWGEYDDLIGHGEDDAKVPVSATSSHGVPFQYESFESRPTRREDEEKRASVGANVPIILDKGSSGGLRRLELTSSSVYSPDLSLNIKNALSGLPSPATPLSFTDFISGYGERNNSIIAGSGGTKQLSSPHGERNSRPTSAHSRSGSMNERTRQSSDSRLMTISEQNHESPIAQVNLRVGSMTVSKWLSFGHVLFSPAREEVLQADDPAKHHSILVVDGLGNGK